MPLSTFKEVEVQPLLILTIVMIKIIANLFLKLIPKLKSNGDLKN